MTSVCVVTVSGQPVIHIRYCVCDDCYCDDVCVITVTDDLCVMTVTVVIVTVW